MDYKKARKLTEKYRSNLVQNCLSHIEKYAAKGYVKISFESVLFTARDIEKLRELGFKVEVIVNSCVTVRWD